MAECPAQGASLPSWNAGPPTWVPAVPRVPPSPLSVAPLYRLFVAGLPPWSVGPLSRLFVACLSPLSVGGPLSRRRCRIRVFSLQAPLPLLETEIEVRSPIENLSLDEPDELEVPGHDCDPLGCDGAHVGFLVLLHHVVLGGFLEGYEAVLGPATEKKSASVTFWREGADNRV